MSLVRFLGKHHPIRKWFRTLRRTSKRRLVHWDELDPRPPRDKRADEDARQQIDEAKRSTKP